MFFCINQAHFLGILALWVLVFKQIARVIFFIGSFSIVIYLKFDLFMI